ncbi:hypothetical protein J2W91_004948 [Paenibacillus amylolyticus]|uniref:Uncharacterized protein n=1 Tax=Paenibacillus amylolyticus TaxID=1451 RepID=A0AAP5H5Z4_PAEAM|nr:hypothetical protein [Paenibacillus amylolyticus]MDR6726437.1 hypothetical protein [Paenibacillus amylolyticus]
MKNKRSLWVTLALAMTITAIIAYASTNTNQEGVLARSNTLESPNSSPVTEDQLIDPMVIDTDKPIGDTVSGDAVVQKSFTVNEGYGHIKLSMNNHSSHSVFVSLTHNNTGKVYFSQEISGKENFMWKSFEQGFEQGLRGGDYTLQWSGGGSQVNGDFSGVTGSSNSDVMN